MNPFEKYFWDVIRNHYADFNGVATRKQFWVFYLTYFVLLLFVFIDIELYDELSTFSIFILIIIILTAIPTWGLMFRRLHDAGFSGWWALLMFISSKDIDSLGYVWEIISWVLNIIIIILLLLPSKIHNNKYRNDNKKNTDNVNENNNKEENTDIKVLYRNLLHKYHPDKAMGDEDKKFRTEIIKKINKAYEERDIDTLRLFL